MKQYVVVVHGKAQLGCGSDQQADYCKKIWEVVSGGDEQIGH